MSAARKTERKGSASTVENACKVCNNKSDDMKWVECDACEKWYHIGCVGLDERDFEFLKKCKKMNKKIFWLCSECEVPAFEVMKSVAEMKEKFEQLQQGVNKLEGGVEKFKAVVDNQFVRVSDEMKEMREDLVKTKSELEKMIGGGNSEFENSWAEVASKHVDIKLGKVAAEVEQVHKSLQEARDEAKEKEDKDARRCNIILYRVPESTADLVAERSQEDKRFCEQLLIGLNVGVIQEDLKKVIRLGKREENVEHVRPVLIQLQSYNIKNLIMENLYKIKSMPQKYCKISIAHDMTKKERHECKTLVEAARIKSQTETGEWVYRVRGPPGNMRIVQFRKQ